MSMANPPEPGDLARQAFDLRRQRRLTQADLSRLTGVAKSDISRFERGRSAPTTRTVDRIARALGARIILVPNDARIRTLHGFAQAGAADKRAGAAEKRAGA
jgi:transcriptional regulator with XRE-family HTH domain